MKSLAVIALLLGMTSLPAADAEPPRARYVPVDGWSSAEQPEVHEEWFGSYLQAMGEPVLSQPESLGGFRQRIRMLVVPGHGHPYAVRIDVTKSGMADVRVVRLEGSGDDPPPRIREQETFTLGPYEVGEVDRVIRAARLQAAPRTVADKPDPPGYIYVCVHPCSYVVESVTEKSSYFVVRNECNVSPRFKKLVSEIDSLRRRVGPKLRLS
ncbi:MAG TPA: hypothetical protein VIT45_05615 [Allosphingosinicella sp.]